ncbi:hypothetical protein DL96DRAFT_1600231 [Flagelloscypha sp. PMI_526]|nr:hypothetical protein DL96DRAFT_1600231 [Flagelloscypha sp. PMI_526]
MASSGYSTPESELESVLPVHSTAARRPYNLVVNSDKTQYTSDHITSTFVNRGAEVTLVDGAVSVTPTATQYEFQTQRNVNRTGLMMIGLGGNNGTTLAATITANRHNIVWHTKGGVQQPNYIGSLLRASTVQIGTEPGTGKEVHVPIADVLPMAMERAQVAPYLAELGAPLPSIYYPDFIAANQEARADNVVPGNDKQAHLEHLRADIRKFKLDNQLSRCVVFWTANTERYSDIIAGVNDTADNLLAAIKSSHAEVSPSTLFAVAAILEGEPFRVIELAERHQPSLAAMTSSLAKPSCKSVFAEFLVNAGIKPLSIASYNHLGNNDGHNLSAERQFKSKEISKSSVVDDMVNANRLLFKAPAADAKKGTKEAKGEHPDPHCRHQRAIDEYYSEIFCGGRSTINIFNECEDSLLATPLILDLTILTELLTRVQYRKTDEKKDFAPLYSVLSLLSYMLKAPLVKPGTEVVNSLNRQRNALESFLKACVGLESNTDLLLDTRIW